MTNISSNSVRFVKLRLRDYGIFLGLNELNFDRHRTLIVGSGGTGKTTIVNALAQLGPAKGVKVNSHATHPEMSAKVVTKGNRNLVKEYKGVIFLSEETQLSMFNQQAPFADILKHHDLEAVRTEAWKNFQAMQHWKTDSHKDLIPQTMATGERICLAYAYVFAVRKVLNLDLPAVLDSPYSALDDEQRSALRAFLRAQPYQQILLGSVLRFDGEDRPHYILDYNEDYSIIRSQ